MDGTIADTLPICVSAVRQAIEPILDQSLSDEEIIMTFGPSEEGTMKALLPPERYDEGLAGYLDQYRKLHDRCRKPFAGITELIRELKRRDVKVALVTGKGRLSLEITLEILGLHDIFEAIEVGSPDGPNKPAGIRNVLHELAVRPEDCVYVGDATSDVTAAREAGVSIISAAWAQTADVERLKSLGPDKICHTVTELEKFLLGPAVQT